MPQLTLWKLDASPPSNAVRVLAEILGLDLDLIDVDFATMEHKSPEFYKINPVGTVPVLKDGDFILTDSHAQMKYLLNQYGGSQKEKLYPSDVKLQAIVDQSLFLDTGVLFIKGVKAVALPTIFEGLKAPTERHIKELEDGYRMVEAYIGDKKFIATEHLTIADIAVGATISASTAIHKLDKTRFPITSAWLDRLFQVPEFSKYLTPGNEILGTLLNACWAKNNSQ